MLFPVAILSATALLFGAASLAAALLACREAAGDPVRVTYVTTRDRHAATRVALARRAEPEPEEETRY